MIYFFYGPDTYRLHEKIMAVTEKFRVKNPSGFNLKRFDFNERPDFEEVKSFLQVFSMFNEKKLALIEGLFDSSSEQQEKILKFFEAERLEESRDNFIVVVQELWPVKLKTKNKGLEEKYAVKNEKLWKFLIQNKKIASEEFEFLSGASLKKWIKTKIAVCGGRISDSAVEKMAFYIGGDLWQQSNELNKLLAFKKNQLISEEDVDQMVKAKIEDNIFQAIDALVQRQKSIAFKLFYRQLAQGETENYFFNRLIFQFRNLLLIKEQIEKGVPFYQLEKKFDLNPFVIRKSFSQAQGFSLKSLKKIYERLGEIDRQTKSGRVELTTALDLLISEVAV